MEEMFKQYKWLKQALGKVTDEDVRFALNSDALEDKTTKKQIPKRDASGKPVEPEEFETVFTKEDQVQYLHDSLKLKQIWKLSTTNKQKLNGFRIRKRLKLRLEKNTAEDGHTKTKEEKKKNGQART